jgi:hypothetical protein
LQLGDGDILTVSETSEVTRAIPSDKRLVANETTSLCTATVKDFRSSFQPLSNTPPALILLSTDGYANSFRDEEGFLKVGSDIWSIIQEDGIEKVDADLKGWLTSATRTGSGDDITLGILCRMSALNKKAEDSDPDTMNKATTLEKPISTFTQPENTSNEGENIPFSTSEQQNVSLQDDSLIAVITPNSEPLQSNVFRENTEKPVFSLSSETQVAKSRETTRFSSKRRRVQLHS